MLLLLAVLYAGASIGGSQRWFLIGPLSLQPSEIAKIALIVVLAHYFSAGPHRAEDIRYFFGSMIITAVPAFLVYREPDLGTTLMFLGIWGAMVFMAGVPFRYLNWCGNRLVSRCLLATHKNQRLHVGTRYHLS